MRKQSSPSSLWTRAADARRPRLVAGVVLLIAAASGAGEPTAGSPSGPVLSLTYGGFVAGELKDSDGPGTLRWQGKPFVEPFVFPTNAVNTIQFPLPQVPPKPTGDYCFELAGGDVLFGSLVGLNDEMAELEVPKLGRLHVERSKVHRLYRWRDGGDVIYLGPNGLTGWLPPSPKDSWREDAGQLVSERGGSTIRGDLGIPAKASVEFEISWKSKPDFVLALGVDGNEKTIQHAFRFEVWEGDLVVVRETEQEADMASVQAVGAGAGRVHLQAYLDQEKGRIFVFSPSGKPLADLKVAEPRPGVLAGLYLSNRRGDIRLERLRIGRWDGAPPREARADKSRIHRADGSIAYGQVAGFDASSKEFLIRGDSGESRVPEAEIASVFLSLPKDEPSRAIRAVDQDGSRLSGALQKVEKGEVCLAIPGFKETPRLPISSLGSLVVLSHEGEPAAEEELSGTLELDGVRLRGRLVDAKERPGASCLAWQPVGSESASPLRPGVAGRVVYREPPPPQPQEPQGARQVVNGRVVVQRQAAGAGGVDGFFKSFAGNNPQAPAAGSRRALHLRTGDVIPCEVTKIDEKGVSFKTSLSDSTFVPHDKIKAVELAPEPYLTIKLTKSKRDRLLTLPRMQKDNPPTHMVRSKNGDYLRGRVAKMDDKALELEVRLETKTIPRDRISRIIWLQPEELDPAKDPAKTPKAEETTRVQALRSDGIRLTFSPEKLEEAELSGKSEVLGECQVLLNEVDQLLIGGAIEKSAATLAYGLWKLQNAPEPKFMQDDGQSPGGLDSGKESALVGKPAPDFELDLLGGKTFHLADTKGKVVVLDFWATWCGPCLQAMPQVDRVTREFPEKDLKLVAVNLQEEPKQISGMLERHKLHMSVALDRDGTVAEKYGAHAIPQTVIIDRDGTVARLFVGAGPHFDDQLREALKALLPDGKPKEKEKEAAK